MFIKRGLDDEKSGTLVWDTARIDNRCTEYPKNSERSQGWFRLKLDGEADVEEEFRSQNSGVRITIGLGFRPQPIVDTV
ncbi:hypothetical protein FD723_32185 (plasmid) [Nostoc sp. C052]|uniref:hypothetical protein n=1 Tax=Nostoc sp. C052 TaxID=2576902 RepID=UPI0015C39B8E|nr:hypothetical protein [Nostoc sp. C052]QLE45031.1 hypothetical protein FD723_32185 [Nostoc sp. C052]